MDQVFLFHYFWGNNQVVYARNHDTVAHKLLTIETWNFLWIYLSSWPAECTNLDMIDLQTRITESSRKKITITNFFFYFYFSQYKNKNKIQSHTLEKYIYLFLMFFCKKNDM